VIVYVDLEVALVLILNFLAPICYILNNLSEAFFVHCRSVLASALAVDWCACRPVSGL
jgi:hypothetical protein